jgi:hypothetical protein
LLYAAKLSPRRISIGTADLALLQQSVNRAMKTVTSADLKTFRAVLLAERAGITSNRRA